MEPITPFSATTVDPSDYASFEAALIKFNSDPNPEDNIPAIQELIINFISNFADTTIDNYIRSQGNPPFLAKNLESCRESLRIVKEKMSQVVFEIYNPLNFNSNDERDEQLLDQVTKMIKLFQNQLAKDLIAQSPNMSRNHQHRLRSILRMKINSTVNQLSDFNQFKNEVKLTQTRIQMAKMRGCSPSDITDDLEVSQFAERAANERAELAAKALLDDEKEIAPARKSKKIKKNRSEKAAAVTVKPEVLSSSSSSHSKRSKVKGASVDLKAKFANSILQSSPLYRFDKRVKRWKCRELEQIRQFVDKGEKNYAQLSDDEVRFQRSCHYFPMIDRVLSNPEAKDRYTFVSNTGFGLFASLEHEGTQYHGVIYVAIGEKNTIYHLHFVSLSEEFGGVKIFNDTNTLELGLIPEEGEKWVGVSKASFSLSEDDVLTLSFADEEHKVHIQPLFNS